MEYRLKCNRIVKRLAKVICLYSLFLIPYSSANAQLNTDRITAIGRNALYFNDYVLSIQYFNQVIKLKPYMAEPYLLRSIAKIQLADYNGALKDLNMAIERNPFNPGAYYTRGYVQRQLHHLEEAEQDFTQALIHSPGNRTYLLLRADVRSEMQHYEQALEDINYLLRHEPESAAVIFEKGVLLLGKKDTIEAQNCFLRAVEIEPYNASNWSALGTIQMQLKQNDEALKSFNKSISLGSKWAGDYVNRSILYHKEQNFRAALADLDLAVQYAPQEASVYFHRALLRQEVGDYNRAEDDFHRAGQLDPEHYPSFILDAIISREPIDEQYLREQAQAYMPPKRDRRKEFSARTAQNQTALDEEKYTSESRGSIQNRYSDVINEPNIALTYYTQAQPLRQTNYYHHSVEQYNRQHLLPAPLHFTTNELSLSAELINQHFEKIGSLTTQIDNYTGRYSFSQANQNNQEGAALYLSRAIEFALVKDYASALDDCTRAIMHDPTLIFAYFLRANWRYMQIEYQRATGDIESNAKYEMDFEIMLRDYDYIIDHQPDFSFAYYNKANMLCQQKDFQSAIRFYTLALQIDSDFAEAYFNRGLTYIFIDQVEQGIDDLSRAGELGIYQAYNLITRFK